MSKPLDKYSILERAVTRLEYNCLDIDSHRRDYLIYLSHNQKASYDDYWAARLEQIDNLLQLIAIEIKTPSQAYLLTSRLSALKDAINQRKKTTPQA